MAKILPRYPVFIPSKGRWQTARTAIHLRKQGVPFRLVVQPNQLAQYEKEYDRSLILSLDKDEIGLPATRNWIQKFAKAEGHARHWQLDDNIRAFHRSMQGRRNRCPAGVALRACEDFTDRYTNVAISGLNYSMFAPPSVQYPPYFLNVHVYSCTLVNHAADLHWRELGGERLTGHNEDVDLCLMALAKGWCTISLNAFLCEKQATMQMKGGMSDSYAKQDGRLRMTRALIRAWPHVVSLSRRFRRPHHHVAKSWTAFDTPLQRRDDIDWDSLEGSVNEYGMQWNERDEKSRD